MQFAEYHTVHNVFLFFYLKTIDYEKNKKKNVTLFRKEYRIMYLYESPYLIFN